MGSAPGWTVPEPPNPVYGSAASHDEAETTEPVPAKPKRGKRFGRNKGGDTTEMPGGANEAADEPDPDVDWVQELKPVGQTDTITAEPETEAKPKRTRKTTKRTRRKLGEAEPDTGSEED